MLLALGGVAFAETVPPSHGDLFEEVWRTVRDGFFDPRFNGVDWDATRQRYGPSAAAARSDGEFAAVVNTMLV